MLIRNCETNLFKENDFNVRTSVLTRWENCPHKNFKTAWIEIIRDSLGGGIVNSDKMFYVNILVPSHSSFNFKRCGTEIASIINELFDKPESIRISIDNHTWIIMVKDNA